MLLPFSVRIGKRRTYFPEKITKSLTEEIRKRAIVEFYPGSKFISEHIQEMVGVREWDFGKYIEVDPKLHTIRADDKNRWKEGNWIHPVVFNRTKHQKQFAPAFKCKGIQEIEIKWYYHDHKPREIQVQVSGRYLTKMEIELLAVNDGFRDVEEFKAWFNIDFVGKIIHWTDLRY